MDTSKYNRISFYSQLSLFGLSFLPFFLILFTRIISEKQDRFEYGGLTLDAFMLFVQEFGVCILILLFSIFSCAGSYMTIKAAKFEKELGRTVSVTLLNTDNQSSEALGYLSSYVIPLVVDVGAESNFLDAMIIMGILLMMFIVYRNSKLQLINPILSLWYNLYEIEFEESGHTQKAMLISDNKDIVDKQAIDIFEIGNKMYFNSSLWSRK